MKLQFICLTVLSFSTRGFESRARPIFLKPRNVKRSPKGLLFSVFSAKWDFFVWIFRPKLLLIFLAKNSVLLAQRSHAEFTIEILFSIHRNFWKMFFSLDARCFTFFPVFTLESHLWVSTAFWIFFEKQIAGICYFGFLWYFSIWDSSFYPERSGYLYNIRNNGSYCASHFLYISIECFLNWDTSHSWLHARIVIFFYPRFSVEK